MDRSHGRPGSGEDALCEVYPSQHAASAGQAVEGDVVGQFGRAIHPDPQQHRPQPGGRIAAQAATQSSPDGGQALRRWQKRLRATLLGRRAQTPTTPPSTGQGPNHGGGGGNRRNADAFLLPNPKPTLRPPKGPRKNTRGLRHGVEAAGFEPAMGFESQTRLAGGRHRPD